MFLSKDPIIYDDLFDVEAPTGTLKGDGAVVQDVLGFYVKNAESNNEEVAFIYRDRQVESAKRMATGEAILAGDRLYAYRVNAALPWTTPQLMEVSPIATGVAGTDYCFCGWAKRDAGALDAVVLMNFDGTRFDETV
jgi:hypothetical protein